jgi:hypothetical protein
MRRSARIHTQAKVILEMCQKMALHLLVEFAALSWVTEQAGKS